MGKHSSCITWVPILWGKCHLFTKSKAKDSVCAIEGPIPDLPSDIIINILTRLPAICIFKLWEPKSDDLLYDLTTTPHFMRAHLHFMRTHLDQATPTIVVQSILLPWDNRVKLSLFDGEAEMLEEAASFDFSIFNNMAFKLWGSYDGFLLFRSRSRAFCILNPITKEQVIVISPYMYGDSSYVCGFYFNAHKKEYELVSVCYLGNQVWEFQILNLRTSVCSCSFPPRRKRQPVFINATFYWMVDWKLCSIANGVFPSLSESILSLNIETGEFGAMEVVEPFGTSPGHRKDPELEFQLFEMEGELSLFGTSSSTHGTPEVGIWVFNLIDKCWVKKHTITSPNHKESWIFRYYFTDIVYIKTKGEFIAYDRRDTRKQPLIYNLRLGTWRLFESKGFKGDRFVITTHTPSLVSLDAGDSVIPLHVI